MGNISLDLYQYFYYVSEFKSITKAANFLYVSQPAVTKQIKVLENKLGKELIERKSSGITLTYDGEILYNEIKSSIEKLNMVESIFLDKCDKYNDTIKIVAGHSTIKNLILPVLTKFNEMHPTIKFELSTFQYQESIQMLREGKVDLIFLSLQEVSQKYSNIVIEKYMDANNSLVYGNKLKFPNKVKTLELNNYPIICKSNFSVAGDYLKKYFNKYNIEFLPKYELNNNWLIEEYARMNLGIGIVTREFVQDEIESGKLIELKLDKKLPSKELGYAYRMNSNKYVIIKEFTNMLKKINIISNN